MDGQKQKIEPNYQRIYTDLINKKFPHKIEECRKFLEKPNLSALEIIALNKKIFGGTEKNTGKHKSYTKTDILEILNYQKKNKLNNKEVALHFSLSRNSVAKWKKQFL